MGNKLFNVNGRTKQQLTNAIQSLLLDEYGKFTKVRGWYFLKNKGLVLSWSDDKTKAIPFTNRMGQPSEVSPSELIDILWDWLQTDEAKTVELGSWEEELDHDGSNELGWRLYTEDWGHIKNGHDTDHYSIAAFKPCWLWYGK